VTYVTSGTNRAAHPTNPFVRCDRFREAASSRLDGEPIGMSAASLDHHLATCPDCARWTEDATRLTRKVRLGTADVPDLADGITADVVLPTRRVLRRRLLLRLALGIVAVTQLAIAIPSISGTALGMAMSEHAAHEDAAWNIAIGIAFVAAALAPRRAAGLVPLLASFIIVLAALSVHDIAAGTVSFDRLLTHLSAVVGLLLLLAMDRAERALPPRRLGAMGDSARPERGLRGVA
jgi:predicted anti-sigma-YlaC factor YlaD